MGKTIGRPRVDIKIQQAIKQMFAEGKSGCQIAKELGISKSTTYGYINFEIEKAKAISNDMTLKQRKVKLDISIRLAIQQMFAEGRNGCQIAKELGINRSTVYSYINLEKAKAISNEVALNAADRC